MLFQVIAQMIACFAQVKPKFQMLGDVLYHGTYTLEDIMGRGVFSHVFKARVNSRDNLNVVIKIYKQNEVAGNYTAHVHLF